MEYINEDIAVIRNGIFPSNTYLLKCSERGDCVIIDPGLDTERIMEAIVASGWKPVAVLATHGHFDHIGSVAAVKEKYNTPFYLHQADYKISQSANFYLKMARVEAKVITVKPDHFFKEELDTVRIESLDFNIHLVPGHSDGSCIIQWSNYLFSGDLIFEQGVGDDSIPRANTRLLARSLSKLVADFNDTDLILPGHGNAASLGAIKTNNAALHKTLLNQENTHV